MKKETLINGITLTELHQINDERGSVLHLMQANSPEFIRFGECYFSEVLPGVIKAWKRHRCQTQNIAVPVGRIRMVIYDDRENSSTRGSTVVLEMGRPDSYFRLKIPPGLWYGFQCISLTPALIANCTDMPHDPIESDLLQTKDSKIPYQWS